MFQSSNFEDQRKNTSALDYGSAMDLSAVDQLWIYQQWISYGSISSGSAMVLSAVDLLCIYQQWICYESVMNLLWMSFGSNFY